MTPWSRCSRPPAPSIAATTVSSAALCSADSDGRLDRAPTSTTRGRRRRCSTRRLTSPRASRRPRVCRSIPSSASSSPCRELDADRGALAGQPLQREALASSEPRPVAKRGPAGLGGGGKRLEPGPRPPPPSPDAGRQHQLQPASRSGAVLAGHPEAEPDELGRRPRRQRLDRLREPLRRQLARLGEGDHDSDHPPAAERDQQDAADADLAQPLGQAVVERPAQRPGGGQRLNSRDRHPQWKLGAAADAAGPSSTKLAAWRRGWHPGSR